MKVKYVPITLTQVLKMADVIDSGGQLKATIEEMNILVNGEKEVRRQRKLYYGDIVEVAHQKIVIEADD